MTMTMEDVKDIYKDMPLEKIIEQCLLDSKEWFPNTKASIPFMALALAGEVGEFANMVKKMVRSGRDDEDLSPEEKFAVRLELIDIFIYLCNLFGEMNIDVPVLYGYKREVNAMRFGDHG